MKSLIITLAVAFAVAARAQTFVNFHVPAAGTNFCAPTFCVPTNTLAKFVSFQNYYPEDLFFNYPSSTNEFAFETFGETPSPTLTVLGPAIITFWHPGEGFVLIELDAVNTTPAISGFAVQPSNAGASIALETSTNLTTWTAATNGVYDKDSSARFFRMDMSVQ
jgi:hypothetical protein